LVYTPEAQYVESFFPGIEEGLEEKFGMTDGEIDSLITHISLTIDKWFSGKYKVDWLPSGYSGLQD